MNATLQSPDIKDQAVAFVDGVLGEPEVQHGAGETQYGAHSVHFVPGFLGGGRSRTSTDGNGRPHSKSDPGTALAPDMLMEVVESSRPWKFC